MISLLILLPVFLLILSALGMAILRQTRPGIGWPWIWAMAVSILSLGVVLFLRWWLPLDISIGQWQPFGPTLIAPAFLYDYVSWPYVLSLSALLLAVIFTDATRLQQDATPLTWILSLLIGGLGLLAVMAGNPLALILSWTAIDLLELIGVFSTRAGRFASQPMILVFAVRVTGTLLVLAALLLSSAWGLDFSLAPIPPRLAFILLLAVGLRLGVLPLNLPFTREVYSWRGLGNLLRMVGPASGLMVLGRMPEGAVPPQWQPWLLFFAGLAAIYGSTMWLASNPRQSGHSYWIIALSALAIGSVIRGSPQASIVWGTALVLIGSVLFLFSAQNQRIMVFPLLAVIGLTGLPFTPAALGWAGLIGPRFDLYSLLFIVSILFLCWGFVRRLFQPREELYVMERWIHTIYPAGLLALVIAQWLIEASNWRNAFSLGVWWAPAATTIVALLVTLLMYRGQRANRLNPTRFRWLTVAGQRVGNVLAGLFRLNWLYTFLYWIYLIVQRAIHTLTAIFEGDGGVMWTMVMLALLISLVTLGGLR